MTKARSKDQLWYALLAVIFGAAAIIVLRDGVLGWAQFSRQPSQQYEILGAQTADQLMQELQKTVGNDDREELKQIRQDAQGL